MDTLKFKTNINCASCVAKVTPFLNDEKSISRWHVDTSNPNKILSVEGNSISPSLVEEVVKKSGFRIFGTISNRSENMSQNFWANKLSWKKASYNTLNCLIGCSIGDFGTIIYLQANHPEMSMWLMMGLAIIAGLITSVLFESLLLKFKEGFPFRKAVATAFSMSFISMLAMEISENMTDYILTSGGNVPLNDTFYWVALGISMMAGFLIPLPYNYYKLEKHGVSCH